MARCRFPSTGGGRGWSASAQQVVCKRDDAITGPQQRAKCPTSALQRPRLAQADEFAHHKPEVESADVDEQAFEDVLMAAQVRATHAAGVQYMREGAFQQFTALT